MLIEQKIPDIIDILFCPDPDDTEYKDYKQYSVRIDLDRWSLLIKSKHGSYNLSWHKNDSITFLELLANTNSDALLSHISFNKYFTANAAVRAIKEQKTMSFFEKYVCPYIKDNLLADSDLLRAFQNTLKDDIEKYSTCQSCRGWSVSRDGCVYTIYYNHERIGMAINKDKNICLTDSPYAVRYQQEIQKAWARYTECLEGL